MTDASPHAILFDWDNTLVSSWSAIHEAMQATLATMGVAGWSLDETKARARLSVRDAFPMLFGDRWPEARQHYLATFEAIHLDRLAPVEGAAACVRDLAAAGLTLGIVSNKTGYLLRREVAALGWTGHFHRIVGAGDAARDKPDGAPVDLALRDAEPRDRSCVWFVGDAGIDLATARAAGCVAVLLVGPDAGILHENGGDVPEPDLRFASMADLWHAVRVNRAVG